MTKAVIFDMDGVLVDTESWFQQTFLDMLKAHGVLATQEELLVLTGCSMKQENAFFAKKLGITPQEAASLKADWIASHPVDYAPLAREGLKETLQALKEAGLKVAVASSSPMKAIEQMIDQCGLQGFFDAVVSGDELPATKPDPAIYRLTLRKLGVESASARAVEDSLYGVESAKGAGLYVYGFHDPFSNLDLVKADTVIEDLREVPASLDLMPTPCSSC